jgi:hypothetical protein
LRHANVHSYRLPSGAQAGAARVFDGDRHAIATAVFDFNHSSNGQAATALVLEFNDNAVEQAMTPEVINPGCRDFAPMFFHPAPHLWRANASDGFFRKVRLA